MKLVLTQEQAELVPIASWASDMYGMYADVRAYLPQSMGGPPAGLRSPQLTQAQATGALSDGIKPQADMYGAYLQMRGYAPSVASQAPAVAATVPMQVGGGAMAVRVNLPPPALKRTTRGELAPSGTDLRVLGDPPTLPVKRGGSSALGLALAVALALYLGSR